LPTLGGVVFIDLVLPDVVATIEDGGFDEASAGGGSRISFAQSDIGGMGGIGVSSGIGRGAGEALAMKNLVLRGLGG